MKILQVCSYAAPYEGSFMKSLFALEKALAEKGHVQYYAFPEKAADTDWCRELQKRTKVFFLPLKKSRLIPQAVRILKKAVADNHIELIHSHFELYDISCKKAAGKDTKVFWHLHDPITKARRPQKNLVVKLQYAYYGKGVTLLSVCDYYKDIAVKIGFDEKSAFTILNGIDLGRITYPYPDKPREYDFLTFGWDFYRKGNDIIFRVLERLAAEGYSFKLLLVCNERTEPFIDKFFNGTLPEWLVVGGFVEDINTLFCNSSTYLQASRKETFCYAVCEAAYAGLDVISSDISGLEWAHSLPSVCFFESENEEQLYDLLKMRLDHEYRLPPFATESSRKIVEKEFSVNNWVMRVMHAYGL